MTYGKFVFLGFVALMQLVSFNANAAPAVTSFDNPAVFFGQEHSVGYRFTADKDLSVASLGFFDSNRDGLVASHAVGIYDSNQTLLASVNVTNASTLNGDFRYSKLASALNLVAGKTYFIAGTTGGGDGWVYQANNIVTNNITYTGSYYHSNTTALNFPETAATDRQYMTVNFDVAAVPEPSTYAMLAAGLGLLGFAARHKKA